MKKGTRRIEGFAGKAGTRWLLKRKGVWVFEISELSMRLS